MESPKFPKNFKISSKPAKFCPGCGYSLILKSLGWVIDEMEIQNTSVLMTDIGCNLLAWDYFDLPSCQTHHGRTVATAVGFKMANPQKMVICLIGDGGGYAIGLQNLVHASLRNNPMTVILVNNTNYGMTGGQFAPTTLDNQVTDSTPFGKDPKILGRTFMGPELLQTLSWKGSYIARGSTDKPHLLKTYFKNALEAQKKRNFSFVEVVSACPLNWKTDAQETIGRLEELEKFFPQGELK